MTMREKEKSGIVFLKIELTFFSAGTQNHKNDNAMMVMLMLFFPFLLAGFIFLVSVLFIWKSNHEFFFCCLFFHFIFFLHVLLLCVCLCVCVEIYQIWWPSQMIITFFLLLLLLAITIVVYIDHHIREKHGSFSVRFKATY